MFKIEKTLNYDVLVVGGGPSGIFSALTAAREGKKTAIIERYGFLGGCATMSLVVPLMTFHAGKKQIIKGYAQEMLDRMADFNGTLGHLPDPVGFAGTVTPIETECYKIVAQEMLLEAGVDIYYHSELFGVDAQDNTIKEAYVKMRSGFYGFTATTYIDASGDGDLAYYAGAPMNMGRPSDGKVQPMSMIFKVNNVDRNEIIKYVNEHRDEFVVDETIEDFNDVKRLGISGFFKQVEKAHENGDLNLNRDRVLMFESVKENEMVLNMSRIVNRNALVGFDLSEATIEGRRQVVNIVEFLRKYIPGCQHARVVETPVQVGVRETRRLSGEYEMTAEDVVVGRKFEDGVALGSWPIDIHDPEGKKLIVTELEMGSFYQIPYRSMITKSVTNLIVTGRLISATHEAFASTRVSPICMALGQAAGMAASIVPDTNSVLDVDTNELIRRLKDKGQVIE